MGLPRNRSIASRREGTMIALRAGCMGAVLLSAAALADVGDPLPGLTADEIAAFQDGKADFTEVETVADGLGPVFNEASCVACHTGPKGAIGGTNQRLETRFGRYKFDGTFDPLAALGGSLLQDTPSAPMGRKATSTKRRPFPAPRTSSRVAAPRPCL